MTACFPCAAADQTAPHSGTQSGGMAARMATRVNTSELTTAQIRALGWSALVRELGASGALRFMMDTERGSGDYTAERHELLPDMDVDSLVREARTERTRRNGGTPPKRKAPPNRA